MTDDRTRKAVEIVECYADGEAQKQELERARKGASNARDGIDKERRLRIVERRKLKRLAYSSVALIDMATSGRRDLVPYLLGYGYLEGIKRAEKKALHHRHVTLIRDIIANPFHPITVNPSWLTRTVVGLAQAIYTDRAFDRLPILADALEEAGCTDADILAHCRGPGPHVRGCWVVDLILGKS
jgi:hypothetical protein